LLTLLLGAAVAIFVFLLWVKSKLNVKFEIGILCIRNIRYESKLGILDIDWIGFATFNVLQIGRVAITISPDDLLEKLQQSNKKPDDDSTTLSEEDVWKKIERLSLLDGFFGRYILGSLSIRLQQLTVSFNGNDESEALEFRINEVTASKHLNVLNNTQLQTMYGKNYSNKHEISVSIGSFVVGRGSLKAVHSNEVTSFTLSFADMKKETGCLGVYFYTEGCTVMADAVSACLRDPFIMKLKEPRSPSVQKAVITDDIVRRFLRKFKPRLYIIVQSVSGSHSLLGGQLEQVSHSPEMFLKTKSLTCLVAPEGSHDAYSLNVSAKSVIAGIANMSRNDDLPAHLFSLKYASCTTELTIDGKQITSLKTTFNIKSPHAVIDEKMLQFYSGFVVQKSILNNIKGLIDNTEMPLEGKGAAHLSLLIFKLQEVSAKLSATVRVEVSDVVCGVEVNEKSSVASYGSGLYVSMPFASATISMAQCNLPKSEPRILLEGAISLHDANVGYLVFPSSEKPLYSVEERNRLARIPAADLSLKICNHSAPECVIKILEANVTLLPLMRQGKGYFLSYAARLAKIADSIQKAQVTKDSPKPATGIQYNLRLDTKRVKVCLPSEMQPFHCTEVSVEDIIFTRKSGDLYVSMQSLSVTGTSAFNSVEAKTKELLVLNSIAFNNKQASGPNIKIETMSLSLSLTQIYILLSSVRFSLQVIKLIEKEKVSNDANSELPVSLMIPNASLIINLPGDVLLSSDISDLTLVTSSTTVDCKFKSVVGDLGVPGFDRDINGAISPCRFVRLDAVCLTAFKCKPLELIFHSQKLHLTIPATFPFSNLIENSILLNKAVKVMMRDLFGKRS
jgi:hypothetical protein